jgi:hypothetical protein
VEDELMSRIGEAWLRRSSGLKILGWSGALAILGSAPLSLYIKFGPADSNPIGLGLLAILSLLVGALGAIVGLLKMLVESFANTRSRKPSHAVR